MQEHGHRMDSSFAFENMTPRRRRAFLRKVLVCIIASVAIIAGCILHIEKECSLGLEPLPEEAYAVPAPAEQVEPEYPLYDIPLSADLQKLTFEKCMQWDVDPLMVYAIIEVESDYRPNLISDTEDYGLMQINGGNMDYLMDSLGTTNLLDADQNIEAGIFWLWGIRQNCTDPNEVLMVYNLGGVAAHECMEAGQESTWYSRKVLRTMDEIRERRVKI